MPEIGSHGVYPENCLLQIAANKVPLMFWPIRPDNSSSLFVNLLSDVSSYYIHLFGDLLSYHNLPVLLRSTKFVAAFSLIMAITEMRRTLSIGRTNGPS